ncbi:MAG: M48 family metallopeptidase [Alphaproteobacteria bacterium]
MTTHKYSIAIHNQTFPIVIRRHKTARRIVLRYQPLRGAIGLTLPRYATIRQGLDFIASKEEWIAHEVLHHRHKIAFADGSTIPVMGVQHTLCHAGGRGTVTAQDNKLLVHGDAAFMERRVRDWIKHTAYETISSLAFENAKLLGVTIKKISLRDTGSHWGSCNASGRLSFSWRLAFAPKEVLEYVVCHEVAHLKELNHSKAFWQIVAALCPHWQASRRWLKTHGGQLYLYGN